MSTVSVDNKTQQQEQQQKLSERARNNLSELDLEIVTSSQFFKPEPEKTYVIRIDPEDKVSMVRNPKFADKDGYIPTRFEFKIQHPNNEVEQTFTVSKTLCKQLKDELDKGYQFLEITRHGSDRSTTWTVKEFNDAPPICYLLILICL
jgi:hypothetical protein